MTKALLHRGYVGSVATPRMRTADIGAHLGRRMSAAAVGLLLLALKVVMMTVALAGGLNILGGSGSGTMWAAVAIASVAGWTAVHLLQARGAREGWADRMQILRRRAKP